ncbi:MAG TPA: hypothetical protein VE172_05350 [Stackebrandtia sp.]|jgi:hypothetical protein|uniref:hypothetical protein n=1 Tax=Stackebrandtia sp. TaxID=2023065 RepID=UPI002D50689E|nr:hypothetical protein [Stackebrandtia sp.]HZE38219.1 hypothetical protein [Stackebrandtia sp.]
MSDNSGTSRPEHTGELMAGLEIVGAPAPPPRPPEVEETREHALEPIREMWRGAESRTAPAPPPAVVAPPSEPDEPRSLLVALPGLIILAALAAFFAWTGAEATVMAAGHSSDGVIVVHECAGGAAPRCVGTFQPPGHAEPLPGLRVIGDETAKHPHAAVPARIASSHAATAYVGGTGGLWWRAGLGLVALLACGFGIAAVTGAWRWRGRARSAAVLSSLAAPLALWLLAVVLAW